MQKIWGHTDMFPFGKYRGKSLGHVVQKDPQYFLWLEKNIPSFRITDGIMNGIYFLMGEIDEI